MNLRKSIRQDSRLDSKRQSKGINCRIVHGELLDFIKSLNLIPVGMYFNSNGYCPEHAKIICIPVTEYISLENIYRKYQNKKTDPGALEYDLNQLDTYKEQTNLIKKMITQHMVFAIIEIPPDGKAGGLDPKKYDVVIDSLEIKGLSVGKYIIRNKTKIQKESNA